MVVVACVSALSMAGCENRGGTAGGGDEQRAPPPYTPGSDIAYIDALVPHHEMALAMANPVIAKSSNAEIVRMATTMRDMQTAEIALLKDVRERLTGNAGTPDSDDPHADDDLDRILTLSGPALDRAFLEEMIPHHASAISMSHRAIPFLDTPELAELAQMTVVNQAKESGEMASMLETMRSSRR